MKNLFKSIIILCLIITSIITVKAQPSSFNYQAVVRDASGNILANRTVGFRFKLTSVNQTFVFFIESQTLTTNNYGVLNAVIGSVNTTGLANLDWSTPYIYHVEIDPAGGTNYTLNTSGQFKSVPYALYAKTAKTTDAVEGLPNYIPKFETNNKLTNSKLFELNDKIGIGTQNPAAALDINSSTNYVLNCNSTGTNSILNLNSTQNSTLIFSKDNNANFSFVTNGTRDNTTFLDSKLDLIGTIASDTFFTFENYVGFFSYGVINAKSAFVANNTLQIGKNGDYISSLYHGRTDVGSSATQKKIITITLPEIQQSTNYEVSATLIQENAISDVFTISVTNKTTQGFQVVIYRLDATTGWGQNPKINWNVINQF